MSNEKHYPLHPNQSHPPIMTCEIPLEEYESLKRENEELKAKADKLHSCLKCLVMRDLIKDCPEKESAIEIVKEYDKWTR